jgi:hypothetical protein
VECKRDPIFARKPDRLPFQAYSAAEQVVASSMQLAGAAYSATANGIHTPMPRSSDKPSTGTATADAAGVAADSLQTPVPRRRRQPVLPLPTP